MNQVRGSIFNIQNFSIHDGPGVRTVIFFKGCNLKCRWCHNPESISFKPQLFYYREKCINCSRCVDKCVSSAHLTRIDGKNIHIFDRDKCSGCLSCVDTCYAEALVRVGETVSVDYVIKLIMNEKAYYGDNGGVTLSGGECMLQLEFLTEILKECKENGINTAVDTAGNVPWCSFEQILEYTDLFLYDIKAADSDLHYKYTKTDNRLILSNLKKLSDLGKRIWIRIPFIKEANGDDMEAIAEIVSDLRTERVDLLPYHRLGNSKYEALGISDFTGFDIPDTEDIKSVISVFKDKGINIMI